jgi:uncharacterized protein (DUF1800 family)
MRSYSLFLLSAILLASVARAGTQESPYADAAHVMNRLAFGARPGEVDKLAAGGKKAIWTWIREQLHPEFIHEADLDARLAKFKSLSMSSAQLEQTYIRPMEFAKENGIDPEKFKQNDDLRAEIRKKIGEDRLPEKIDEELVAQKLIRAVESKKQLQEVLVDFWFNHFNVDISKGEERWLIGSYERDAIRPNIFGKFKDLLSATAHHPAMLFYLDNHLSHNKGLNENYAREIMELHTLGVDGGYTQKDVTEMARILTGWSIETPHIDPAFKFRERQHDRDPKVLLGETFPAGHGVDEGERAIDLIAHHPSTAKRIATLLCQLFISDHPSPQLVRKIAKAFADSDGNLREVYLAIFESPEFWSKDARQAKIKTPFQYVVSAIRSNGGELENKSQIPGILREMGEPLYHCAPPTGYADRADAWVNPGALVSRLNFGLKLAANRVEGVFVQLPHLDHPPSAPLALVRLIEKSVVHEPLSPSSEKIVLQEFDKGEQFIADGEVRPLSEAKAVGLILGSPEFQRR